MVQQEQQLLVKTKNQPAVEKKPLTKQEKNRTWAIVILTCFVVFFWAGFEQAGSSLTLYTDKFVDRTIFGWEIQHLGSNPLIQRSSYYLHHSYLCYG